MGRGDQDSQNYVQDEDNDEDNDDDHCKKDFVQEGFWELSNNIPVHHALAFVQNVTIVGTIWPHPDFPSKASTLLFSGAAFLFKLKPLHVGTRVSPKGRPNFV
eukprot:12399184-Karenia_brevis.AAC.1